MDYTKVQFSHGEPLVKPSGRTGPFEVSAKVNTKSYRDAFDSMPLPRPVIDETYRQSGRILQKANGTELEYMAAIDARTGILVTDNLCRLPKRLRSTSFCGDEVIALAQHKGDVVLVHNHPSSMQPSYRDVLTAGSDRQIAASVVVGHDGSVWFLSISNTSVADAMLDCYNECKTQFGTFAENIAVSFAIDTFGIRQGFDFRRLR